MVSKIFYYILTEKRKYDEAKVIVSIDALSFEITPFYLAHSDFVNAKSDFFSEAFKDFEDLMVLNSTLRTECDMFMTNDKALLGLGGFKGMELLEVR